MNTWQDVLIINTVGVNDTAFKMRNASMSINDQFFGVVSETQGAINMVLSNISNAGTIAAISDDSTRDTIDMADCTVLEFDSLIANGAAGFISMRFANCALEGQNIIACGNANNAPIQQNGPSGIVFDLGTEVEASGIVATIANRRVGIGVFSGANVRIFNLVSVDNDVGLAVFGNAICTTFQRVDIVDNKRAPSKLGVDIGAAGVVRLGAGTRLLITGNTSADVLAVGSSYFAAVAPAGPTAAIGPVDAQLVSAMEIVGVTVGPQSAILGSFIRVTP